MKLWEVTNGWMGFASVRCLVVAATKEQALEFGQAKYKDEADEELRKTEADFDRYAEIGMPWSEQAKSERLKLCRGERYWNNLQAELLCEDLTQPWCGEVNDG